MTITPYAISLSRLVEIERLLNAASTATVPYIGPHGGAPPEPCNYAVVSKTLGHETARVWLEDDARFYAAAYNIVCDLLSHMAYLDREHDARVTGLINANNVLVDERRAWKERAEGAERANLIHNPLLPAASDRAISAVLRDEAGINHLANAMRIKMSESRRKGRGGWHDEEQCSLPKLVAGFFNHLSKGDLRDVANYLMMLYNRRGGAEALAKMSNGYLVSGMCLEALEIIDKWALANGCPLGTHTVAWTADILGSLTADIWSEDFTNAPRDGSTVLLQDRDGEDPYTAYWTNDAYGAGGGKGGPRGWFSDRYSDHWGDVPIIHDPKRWKAVSVPGKKVPNG